MTPWASVMRTLSAVCSTARESSSTRSSAVRDSVTSANTATAQPRRSASSGRVLMRIHPPSGWRAFRTNISSPSTDSPRIARASGMRSGGKSVTRSGRKQPVLRRPGVHRYVSGAHCEDPLRLGIEDRKPARRVGDDDADGEVLEDRAEDVELDAGLVRPLGWRLRAGGRRDGIGEGAGRLPLLVSD